MRTTVLLGGLPKDGANSGFDVQGEDGLRVKARQIFNAHNSDLAELHDESLHFGLGQLGLEQL